MNHFFDINIAAKILVLATLPVLFACNDVVGGNQDSPNLPEKIEPSDNDSNPQIFIDHDDKICFNIHGEQIKCNEFVEPTSPEMALTSSDTLRVADFRTTTSYEASKIGNQFWLMENMQFQVSRKNTWCYNNDERNCEVFGRLYSFYDAQYACPLGWHLPTIEEWNELLGRFSEPFEDDGEVCYKYSGSYLKDSSSWNGRDKGNDSIPFYALPAGVRILDFEEGDSPFFGLNQIAEFWTATSSGNVAKSVRIVNHDSYAIVRNSDVSSGYSVRCVYGPAPATTEFSPSFIESSSSVEESSADAESGPSMNEIVDSRDGRVYTELGLRNGK